MEMVHFAEKHRLKITNDDCGDAIISGKHGHIYEYGSGKLGVCVLSRLGNAYRWNRIRKTFTLAGFEIVQNGDYEGCATFDPENVDQARTAIRCAGVKPKRQVNPEARQTMIANLARARQVKQRVSLLKHWQDGVDTSLKTTPGMETMVRDLESS